MSLPNLLPDSAFEEYPPHTKFSFMWASDNRCESQHEWGETEPFQDKNGFGTIQHCRKCGVTFTIVSPQIQFKIEPI